MNTGLKNLACLATLVACGASASAATIYDNTGGVGAVPTVSNAGVAQIGDGATFAGTERTLTDWSFEYFVSTGSAISGQASLYAVDGSGFPGSLLYQSSVANLSAGADENGYGTFINDGFTPFDLPEEVIWTVTFTGATESDTYGLLYAGSPELGSSADSFYQFSGGAWQIVGTDLEDSFSAQFNAVPEPGTWALLAGGLGMLSFWNYRRKA